MPARRSTICRGQAHHRRPASRFEQFPRAVSILSHAPHDATRPLASSTPIFGRADPCDDVPLVDEADVAAGVLARWVRRQRITLCLRFREQAAQHPPRGDHSCQNSPNPGSRPALTHKKEPLAVRAVVQTLRVPVLDERMRTVRTSASHGHLPALMVEKPKDSKGPGQSGDTVASRSRHVHLHRRISVAAVA